ncbi:hypothetical protein T265_01170 [Opisthorchis viverrini]|uniref:Uncharacterized protein n=1 Tax=Opisthorchis viverrini TaxID=6198 RepID=A0A075AJ73_OPIVI|nr:hypothetical protein T265_01170 [Opisthorchis viverrini]KER32884.1 hypothetical protein T265_01170 [Opisthorchis viverrini]
MITDFRLERQPFPYIDHRPPRANESNSIGTVELGRTNFTLADTGDAATFYSPPGVRKAKFQSTTLPTCRAGDAWDVRFTIPRLDKSTADSSMIIEDNWSPALSCPVSTFFRNRHSEFGLQNNRASDASSLRVNSTILSRSSSLSTHRSDDFVSLEDHYIRSLFDRQAQLKSQLGRLNNELLELLHEEWKITGVVPEGYDELRITTGQPTQPLKTTSFPLPRTIIQRANTFSRDGCKDTNIPRRNTSTISQYSTHTSPLPSVKCHRDTFPQLTCGENLPGRSYSLGKGTHETSASPTNMRITSPKHEYRYTSVRIPDETGADDESWRNDQEFNSDVFQSNEEKLSSNGNTIVSTEYTNTCSEQTTPHIHNDHPTPTPLPEPDEEDVDIRQAFIELQLRRLEVDYAVISELYTVHKKRAAETKREAYRIAYRTNLQKLKEIHIQMEQLRAKLGEDHQSSISQITPRQHRRTWKPLYYKARNWTRGPLSRPISRTCSPLECARQPMGSVPRASNTSCPSPTLFKAPASPTSGSCASRDTSSRLAPDASSECGTESSRLKVLKRVRRPTLLPLLHFFHSGSGMSHSEVLTHDKANTTSVPQTAHLVPRGDATVIEQEVLTSVKPIIREPSKSLKLDCNGFQREKTEYQPSPRIEEYNEFLWPNSLNATPVNPEAREEARSTISFHGSSTSPGYREHGLPESSSSLKYPDKLKRRLKRIRSLSSMVEGVCLDDSPTSELRNTRRSPPKLLQRCYSWSTLNFWLSRNSQPEQRLLAGDCRVRYPCGIPTQMSEGSVDPSRLCSPHQTGRFASTFPSGNFQAQKQSRNAATSSNTSSSNWSTSGCSCMSSQMGDSGCEISSKEPSSDLTIPSSSSRLTVERTYYDSATSQMNSSIKLRQLPNRRQPIRLKDVRGRVPFIEEESGSPYGTSLRVRCICSCLSEHGDQPWDTKSCMHNPTRPCSYYSPKNLEADDGVSLSDCCHNFVNMDPDTTPPPEEFIPRSFDNGETTLTTSSCRSSSLSPTSHLTRDSQVPTDRIKEKTATVDLSSVQDLKRSNLRRSGLRSFSLLKQTVSRMASDKRTTLVLNVNHTRRYSLTNTKLPTPNLSKRKSGVFSTPQTHTVGDGSGISQANPLSLSIEEKSKRTGKFTWTPKLRNSVRLVRWPK